MSRTSPVDATAAMDRMRAGGSHVTVLLDEAVGAVLTRTGGVYVDGTFGRGGHTFALLARLDAQARVVALDRDLEAIAAGRQRLVEQPDPRLTLVHARFSAMAQVLREQGFEQVDGVLLDVGVSSPQIDTPLRGFSFRFDAPLDMRMDTSQGETAAEFLARADVRLLTQVIRDYGEERFAAPIAKALVARREQGVGVSTTGELARLVAAVVKTRERGQDPATRTFQALRIQVNAELEELRQGLNAALHLLRPGGRLAVISFHSLEDRIVKQFMARHAKAPPSNRRMPVEIAFVPTLSLLGGAQRAGEDETATNPRARSAVLRVAERLPQERAA